MKPDHRTVTLTMTVDEAERLSLGLSDLLCWIRGYMAASNDSDNAPFGQDEARKLNEELKRAWREAAP